MRHAKKDTMEIASNQESSWRDTRAISRLSITACLRCRDQKLKCGREKPICARCDRLEATCVYPEPPDRRGPRSKRRQKLLHKAAERSCDGTHSGNTAIQHPCNGPISQEASPIGELTSSSHPVSQACLLNPLGPSQSFEEHAASPSQAGIGDASTSLATGTPVLSDSYPTQLRRMRSIATESTIETKQPALPPTALGLSLLEIYFARIYNASLLFHKPILFQEYLDGKIHGALLKALFALATLFLHPRDDEKESAQDENTELQVLSMYHSCGLPWAKAALREAMPLALESPSLVIAQALECIQLYWFGIGQPHTGNLCLALAYRSCQLLGFDRKIANENDDSVESEFKRRCFWACWTSTCIVMEPEPYIESAWKEVAMLPLPCSISSTLSGCELSFNQMMNGDWHSISIRSSTRDSQPSTTVRLLIKMIGVWAKVQLLCKDHSSSANSKRLNSAQHLSGLAVSLFDDASVARASVPQDDKTPEFQTLLLFHDAVYHQCQIVLQSMIVPLFSGISTDPNVDPETQRKAAETVTHHAELFERLLAPYLYGRKDVSRLPPLVGYGAFVVGIVILSTEITRRNQSVSESPVNAGKMECRLVAVEAILRLLDTLRVYWRALQHPWETLHSALQAGLSAPRKPSRPVDSQDIHSSVYSNNHRSSTLEGSNLPVGFCDGHPQPSATNKNAREHIEITQASAMSRDNGGSSLDSIVDTTANDSSMSQLDLLPDPEWYSLSFAEAGVEQFYGLEPSILFQQGWRAFG